MLQNYPKGGFSTGYGYAWFLSGGREYEKDKVINTESAGKKDLIEIY